jgi:hypothetical protein
MLTPEMSTPPSVTVASDPAKETSKKRWRSRQCQQLDDDHRQCDGERGQVVRDQEWDSVQDSAQERAATDDTTPFPRVR